jgi:two-component system, NtrC family, response regulator AtoC
MNTKYRILIVDDDLISRKTVAHFLRRALGHEVTECSDGLEALEEFSKNPFPIVISDIQMPKMNGLNLLRNIKSLPEGNETAVVLMTGFAEVDSAILALRDGAYDYLEKPIEAVTLSDLLSRLTKQLIPISEPQVDSLNTFEEKVLERNPQITKVPTISIPEYGNIGVYSASMRSAIDLAFKYHEDRSTTALIQGETGTGKEVIARLVHHGAKGSNSPFISINCPAIAPGLFESELFGYEAGAFTGAKLSGSAGKLELAQKGTLFLDEIGDLPLEMQPKLLRVLQEREMYRVGGEKKVELNVRIIAATNYDLKELVRQGKFRQDLYFRLNMGRIILRPLSDDRNSIVSLAQLFLDHHTERKGRKFRFISREARDILKEHEWPGNVRELQNSIERVVLMHNESSVKAEHLNFLSDDADSILFDDKNIINPDNFSLPENRLDLKQLEIEIVRKTLERFKGNKAEAARFLGLTRSAFRRRVEKYIA